MLADAIKNLSKHSLVYACSSYLTKIIGFFLIPFYTHYLPPVPYGKVELFDFSITVIGQLLGINICNAMVRYYLAADDPRERHRVVSTTLIFSSLSSLVAIGMLSLFSRNFSEIFFKTEDRFGLVVIIFLNLFMTMVTHQCFSYIQANRLSGWFLAISVGKLILEVGLRVFFIANLGWGIKGVFLGSLAGGTPFAVVLLAVILWKNRLIFSFETLKKLLLFTLPLIFSGVGMAFLHGVDRFLVFFLSGGEETGIYSAAYKFGYLANALVVSPFLLIWFPYILSIREDKYIRLICSRIQTYFTLLVGYSSLVIAVFAKEVIQIMTESKFHEAYRAVPFVLVGYLFWAMFQIAQAVFFIRGKTNYHAWVTGLSVAVNFGLNFLFIPAFGFVGAAVVTAITFAFLFGITYYYANKLLPIPYEGKRLTMIILAGLFIYGASWLVPEMGLIPLILIKGILLCLYPLILFFIGFALPEERERLVFLLGMILGGPKKWRKLFVLKTWFK